MAKETSLVVAEDKITDLAALTVEAGDEEHLSQDEFELPFLRVAQKGSPQVDEDKPEYIEGLKPGQYFNTATGTNYGDEIVVQVHGYFRNFIIWKGEKGAGEFNGVMTPEEFQEFSAENKLARDGGDFVHQVDGEELRYSDTRNFLISLPEHAEEGLMLYPMSSTGIKAAKKWNTLQNGRRLEGKPTKRYATIWQIKTAGFEKSGYTWKQTSQIKPMGWATPDLIALGKSFEDMVASIKDRGVRYSPDTEEPVEESDF